MSSRVSHNVIWSYPSRKKLFLLVVVVVGLLATAAILLMLKAANLERTPQAPLIHPIVQRVIPQSSMAA